MTLGQIVLAPLLPWPFLVILAVVAVAACLTALLVRARGGLWRGLALLWLLAILSGPSWTEETTEPLPDVALILVDHSQSMNIGNRNAEAAAALSSLTATAAGTDLKVVDIAPASDDGTLLFSALQNALAAIPPAQLAGIVAITDGEVSDTPGANRLAAPLTTLLTARAPETDRELHLLDAPAYSLVGQTAAFRFSVLDHGTEQDGAAATVTVTADGSVIAARTVAVGEPQTINIPVNHAGPIVVAAAVSALPGEVSQINNRVAFTLNGIHKQLNILLISGSPDQGERSWRTLLKSDPAVQLVHFTILRTPGETIDADPNDLALVPFPIHQLFETDIGKFDLIIMDRFNATGLLPPDYLANIATYVENGGALLAELGPEFVSTGSLAFTPLSAVLPATPEDLSTITQQFTPSVTPLGKLHPVTAPLSGAMPPWYRMEAAVASSGDVLMTGPGNAPLLILSGAGKGRVGMLLSDQFWLWTRGGLHDGPALPLLRRIVHWLLREPSLEPEHLVADFQDSRLNINRFTTASTPSATATITSPDGEVSHLLLQQAAPGHVSGNVSTQDSGVWKITQGNLTTYAVKNLANAREYQNLAATSARLAPFSRGVIWLGQNPRPSLASFLTPRHAYRVIGSRDIPLLPPWPALIIAISLLLTAWWREKS